MPDTKYRGRRESSRRGASPSSIWLKSVARSLPAPGDILMNQRGADGVLMAERHMYRPGAG